MWKNVIYSFTGRPDRLFYKLKPDLIKLTGFLKSSSLTHLLNELGRAGHLVGRAIGPWRAAWPIPTPTCTYSAIIKYQGPLIQKHQIKMIQNVGIAQEHKQNIRR
jgi:hypothetical protein